MPLVSLGPGLSGLIDINLFGCIYEKVFAWFSNFLRCLECGDSQRIILDCDVLLLIYGATISLHYLPVIFVQTSFFFSFGETSSIT